MPQTVLVWTVLNLTLVNVYQCLTVVMAKIISTNSQKDVNSKNSVQLSGIGMKEAENVKPIIIVIKLLMLMYNSMTDVLLSVM